MSHDEIAKLALEDGTVFTGTAFGAAGEVDGEVCFNTSMTGYQEILTDPSYRGQIVTMTYPEIGNYGVNADDVESAKPHLAGFIVRELSRRVSNFRAEGDLAEYLPPVRHRGDGGHRHAGAGAAAAHSRGHERRALQRRPGRRPIGREGQGQPGTGRPRPGPRGHSRSADPVERAARAPGPGWTGASVPRPVSSSSPHVVALDYGMKWNIARHLFDMGCRVTILPGTATAEEVLALQPDGVFLSNGPGDPEPLDYAQQTIRDLLGKKPIFGICLGHQLLGLACGAKTYKLKFGHRGANQPVLNR